MAYMNIILGIESSCDETAAAIFDHANKKLLAHTLFSQVELHKQFGGVVPEVASRSHLEKINGIVQRVLDMASLRYDQIDLVAATSKPGLAGSLLVGFCFGKGLAWGLNKPFLSIDHNHGHIASAHLNHDGSYDTNTSFPALCLSVSGGHSSWYLVHSPVSYELIGNTIDDAAGEAFDKTAKIMGLGYPGGAIIEQLAASVGFVDFYKYTRTNDLNTSLNFTFSGLKTAVLYDLIGRGLYNPKDIKITHLFSPKEQARVASSLLVCVGDILVAKTKLALKTYPHIKRMTFVGGVSCNKYLTQRLAELCAHKDISFKKSPNSFCTDNAAMIACAASDIITHSPLKTVLSTDWSCDIFG